MYKVNDYVVYKRKVSKIVEIKKNLINNEDYYILIPVEDESLKISVPTADYCDNLRPLISKKEIKELIKKIPNIPAIENNNRLMEVTYKELLTTDNHEDLVKIIKTTYVRNKERTDARKKASDKDVYYFEQAEKCLYNELSIALNLSYAETKDFVTKEVLKIC